jgi:hypothetical protein
MDDRSAITNADRFVRQAEIERIIFDNGAFVECIQGAQAGIVRVYGEHRVSVDRTMKQIMMLVRLGASNARPMLIFPQFEELTLATVSTTAPHATETPGLDASIESVLKTTASSTKAEVAYRAGQFQVCGTLAEVRKALPMILTSDAVKNTTATIQVQFELSRGELRF